MKGYDLFQVYLGVKLHFTSDSYDFFRFRGKTNTSFESYLKRKDKYWFERLSRSFRGEPVDFFFALFSHNPHQWIGEMLEGGHEEIYSQWQRRMQNFTEELGEDTLRLCKEAEKEGFNWLFTPLDGGHPPVLQAMVRGEISPESFIALDEILGFFPQFQKVLGDDPLWQTVEKRCNKYRPFLRSKGVFSDMFKHRRIIKQKIADSGIRA